MTGDIKKNNCQQHWEIIPKYLNLRENLIKMGKKVDILAEPEEDQKEKKKKKLKPWETSKFSSKEHNLMG